MEEKSIHKQKNKEDISANSRNHVGTILKINIDYKVYFLIVPVPLLNR